MKFFTKEVKIALTAIVAVVLMFFGINFFKGINLFKSSNTYYVKFADVCGLLEANQVFANGYAVGIVRSIDYDYAEGKGVLVGIELDKKMHLPVGTTADLETEMLGGVKMNLRLGNNPLQNIEPGDTLQGGMYQGALSKMSAMVPQIEQLMPKLDSILSNLARLTADPALTQTLHNLSDMTGDLKTTTKSLNVLLEKDVPQLTKKLNNIGANLEKTTGQLAQTDINATINKVNATLESVNSLSKRMDGIVSGLDTRIKSPDNSLGALLNSRDLYNSLDSTVNSANNLLIDLKAHPKRYVHFSVFGRKDK